MTDVMHIRGAAPVPDAKDAPPRPPGRVRRIGMRVGKLALLALAGYYAFCLVLLVVYRFVAPPITTVQLQRRLEALVTGAEYGVDKSFVSYERIPRHVGRAVVAAEDGDFWNHWGFDFDEMRAASMVVFDGEMPRGASTITQQLMKNLFGMTSQNPVRKLLDITLTPPAELILGKERILELYLNNVEWGPGIFGIDAAARHHYGTGVRGLSRSQAAGLAALLPNPLNRTPGSTTHYRAEILRRMAHRGW
ncbi:MAG: monofunctional biosynthetic peptidoglycan transglycosylase [Gemmatimonadaceae bacterium]